MINTIAKLIGLDFSFCHSLALICCLSDTAESMMISADGAFISLKLMGTIFRDLHHHQFTQIYHQWLNDSAYSVNQLSEKEIFASCR